MRRIEKLLSVAAVAAFVTLGSASAARADEGVVLVPQSELKWTPANIPGVMFAVVEGDMTKGPSRFYIKYPAGLVTPLHHHTADHFVTTISGSLVLVTEGAAKKMPPGSYFAFTGKAKHVARCEGTTDCVMFADAKGPWDVVPEEQPAAKH